MCKKIQIIIASLFFTIILIFAGSHQGHSQGMGVSFSFFFPKNGSFSVPISPFSIRGVGIDLNRYVAIETGFSLYRFSGLSITDVPFETNDPVMGPTITFMAPLELVLQVGNTSQQFRIKGGLFFFYNFSNRFLYGNLDRALRDLEGWDVLNSDFNYDNNVGWGYELGAEYIVYVSKQFGITMGVNYFIGGSNLNMRGSYRGGVNGSVLETVQAAYPDSILDLSGWEISLGALFGN